MSFSIPANYVLDYEFLEQITRWHCSGFRNQSAALFRADSRCASQSRSVLSTRCTVLSAKGRSR